MEQGQWNKSFTVVLKSRKGILQKDRIGLHFTNEVNCLWLTVTDLSKQVSIRCRIFFCGFFGGDLIMIPSNFHLDYEDLKNVYEGG